MTTALKTWQDRYLSAQPDGEVQADRTEVREWEGWGVEPQGDGTKAFRAFWQGHYLCAEPDGRLVNRMPGHGAEPGVYERFAVEHLSEGRIALRTCFGTYVCVEPSQVVHHRVPGNSGQPDLYEGLVADLGGGGGGQPGVVPVLSAGARWFRTAEGDFDYREASAMAIYDRVARGEDIEGDLEVWRALGFTHLRLFGMLWHPYWISKGIKYGPSDPGFYDKTAALMDRILAAGLGVRYAVFCDTDYVTMPGGSRALHTRAMAPLLAARPTVISEVANEPTVNGFRDVPQELVPHAQILRQAGCQLVAFGAHHGAEGHNPEMAVAPATYVAFHAERRTGNDGWDWVKRLGEYPVIANGAGMPALSGEPINAGNQGAPGDYLSDIAIWYAYGAISRLVPASGYLPCLHSHQGLMGYAPTGNTYDCAVAFHQGCAAVPLPWRGAGWVNGHHAGSPFEGFSQTEPPQDTAPLRIFGRGGPGNYIGVALRAPRGWSWDRLRYPVELVEEVGTGPFVAQLWRSV